MVTWTSLERLAQISREAGAAIQALSGTDAHNSKSDGSPVTQADRAAHRSILSALASWTPDIPTISEEGVIPPYETRRQWTRFWLVDPLDGTKEFLSRSGEYTVNIALIEDCRPVLGVVLAPALDLLYLAGAGLGAWRQAGAAPLERVYSNPSPSGVPLVVAESRSHPSAALETFLAALPVKRRVQAGSSLKFCWVAEGRADLYPRFGPTMEWDTAAGDCVYRQSGRDGVRESPLQYNTPTLCHDGFVIGHWDQAGCSAKLIPARS